MADALSDISSERNVLELPDPWVLLAPCLRKEL